MNGVVLWGLRGAASHVGSCGSGHTVQQQQSKCRGSCWGCKKKPGQGNVIRGCIRQTDSLSGAPLTQSRGSGQSRGLEIERGDERESAGRVKLGCIVIRPAACQVSASVCARAARVCTETRAAVGPQVQLGGHSPLGMNASVTCKHAAWVKGAGGREQARSSHGAGRAACGQTARQECSGRMHGAQRVGRRLAARPTSPYWPNSWKRSS